jgi:DNA-binding NtrC family response regulator
LISLLAAIPQATSISLESIIVPQCWRLNAFETVDEVKTVIRRTRVPVILTEVTLPDGTWRDLLHATEDLRPRPILIVTCKSPDDRLWAEALSCGAYDVLAQPFDPCEVNHVIRSAWRTWETAVSCFDDEKTSALR